MKKKQKEKEAFVVSMTTDNLGNHHWKNQHGQYHRDDGPAMEYTFGRRIWYQDGKIHRDDGPAYEDQAVKYWYRYGIQHRIDGPAVEYANGQQEYFVNDKRHREDGPALIYADGRTFWYLNNSNFSQAEFADKVKDCKRSKAIIAAEKFADKYWKSSNKDKAGIAILQFIAGECEHSFINKKGECELCSMTI